MKIEWNKVTWYSQLLAIVVFVLVLFVGFRLGAKWQERKTVTDMSDGVVQKQNQESVPLSIETQSIKEENFSGAMPVIVGGGEIAIKARAYIGQAISDFRKQADLDVPAMRKEFGVDATPAKYEIDISAQYVKGAKTESIAITVYTYTGGAHGSSLYKVFTSSISSGEILSLSRVIREEKMEALTSFVKKSLINWRPDFGDNTAVVFENDITDLKFDSFSNWAFNDKDLIIYFDQYAIGPGALGAVAFSLPLDKIKDFLNPVF